MPTILSIYSQHCYVPLEVCFPNKKLLNSTKNLQYLIVWVWKQACVNYPIKGFRNVKKYYTWGQVMVMLAALAASCVPICHAGCVLRTDCDVWLYQKNFWLFMLEMHLISGITDEPLLWMQPFGACITEISICSFWLALSLLRDAGYATMNESSHGSSSTVT